MKSDLANFSLSKGDLRPFFLITVSSYLNENPKYADEKEIRKILSGNICRCTGYVGIVDAVLEVIKKRNENKKNA